MGMHPVQVIAVTGGKGGVGKTNVSVNLSMALADLGRRVMLMDADLGLANVDVLLGLTPKRTLADVIERFLAAEIVRESIFLRTRAEVPYSTAVLIDLFDESTSPLRIVATIIVERSSQKGIVIGKDGAMLGQIRQQATAEISRVFERPVRLELWVKVQKNWTEKKDLLQSLGLPG